MELYEKLSHIQNEMNVPKNLFNKFGNYYYRNAETILETAKPICLAYRTTLTISDELINLDGRYYVKATAILHDWESDKKVLNTALAREEESQKGMSSSQVTGSASSYARKYALNGLFNLDDVKDDDSGDNTKETKEEKAEVLITDSQMAKIKDLYTIDEIKGMEERLNKPLNKWSVVETSKAIKVGNDRKKASE